MYKAFALINRVESASYMELRECFFRNFVIGTAGEYEKVVLPGFVVVNLLVHDVFDHHERPFRTSRVEVVNKRDRKGNRSCHKHKASQQSASVLGDECASFVFDERDCVKDYCCKEK